MLPIAGRIVGGVIPFLKSICPKEKVTVQLELELAYYDSAGQCFNHYNMRTTPIDWYAHGMYIMFQSHNFWNSVCIYFDNSKLEIQINSILRNKFWINMPLPTQKNKK